MKSGSISADDLSQGAPGHVVQPIPNSYGTSPALCMRASSRERTRLGIDVAGESQLVGYPTQYPSVSMVDWSNGKPNARFWVLKLLKENSGPETNWWLSHESSSPYFTTLVVVKPN